MPVAIGSTAIAKSYVGSVEAQKIYVGSTEVWSNFSGGRIDKSGTQTITPTSTWGQVTGWVANSSYPNTVITNNGILIPTDVNVTYTAVLVMGGSPSSTTSRGQVKNGAAVLQTVSLGTFATSVTITGSLTGTGEVLTLEAFTSSTASSRNVVQTSTYILIEKV